MNVEYFGRQYEITPAIRDEVESSLGKLTKILGDNFKSKVILTAEKYRNIAEITVKRRRGHLVGLAEANDMLTAVNQAIEHIETQALRHNGRRRNTHRQPKDKTWQAPAEAEGQIAVGATAATAVPVVVHKFPSVARTTEAHLVKSNDSVAMRPMTIEEAVKECEFRDRDVFVFRDGKGNVKVLHRRKDGKIELIEVP
ncbi:MAG TPA: ribosome-associated translation inhibitor RaiA [Terriglobales bacterium]|jgi:putative sigma-54 modulation protein|nr:ribosome-associated translation inhibitor RaiA [Terriglobales bacterium]